MKNYYLLICASILCSTIHCIAQQPVQFCSPITISVKAVDLLTQKEVPAQFEIFLTKSQQQIRVGATYAVDACRFPLLQADSIYILAKSLGYYDTEDFLVVEQDTSALISYAVMMERDIPFEELKVNEVKKLDKIYFEQGSFLLNATSIEQLMKLYVALRDNPKMKIQIAGHSDNVGNLKINHFYRRIGQK